MDFINVNGQKYPVRWPIGPVRSFMAENGFSTKLTDFDQLQNMDFEQMTKFVHIGLRHGAKGIEKPEPFSIAQLEESLLMHEATAAINVFANTFTREGEIVTAESTDQATQDTEPEKK